MIRVPIPIVAALFLAGCGAQPPNTPAAPKKVSAAEAGYVTPAMVTRVEAGTEGVVLTGTAQPGAAIRLASPDGAILAGKADDKGVWRLTAPAATGSRLFGLSSTLGTRTIQAQGYLLLTPKGRGYLLRAGAGALSIGASSGLTITALDFDREGAAVVSGAAPAGATLTVRADGRQSADGRADPTGRFSISLSQPLAAGDHTFKIFSDGAENSASIDTSPAASLVDGPFRSSTIPAGLRVDWMTPGGGVQSTVILN